VRGIGYRYGVQGTEYGYMGLWVPVYVYGYMGI
jgi:hypothetical protein